MFEYTHASFDIIISDDWETAEVKAEAWVNDTLADELTTMDEFMELLDPNKEVMVGSPRMSVSFSEPWPVSA